MVNAACGGNIENKTPDEAMNLIIEFAESSRTHSKRGPVRGVKAASSNSNLESDVSELKSMFRQFMMSGNQQQVKACGICAKFSHPTDACPILQEDVQDLNAMGNQGQGKYDPFSNTYNPGTRDHPNLSYKQELRISKGTQISKETTPLHTRSLTKLKVLLQAPIQCPPRT